MRRNRPIDPYNLAIRWLAARELTEFQLRQRLRIRQVAPGAIDEVLRRLKDTGVLDDRRTALARARTEALVRRHGPNRVIQRLETMGIGRQLARSVVREVFEQVDERDLMVRALSRRLGRGRRAIDDSGEHRRVYAYLVRQGFEPSAVSALLRAHSHSSVRSDDE